MFKPQITTYEQSRFDGEKVIFPDHPEDITPEDWHIDKIWHYIAESVRDMAEEHRPKKYPFPRFQIGTSTKEKTFLNGKIPVQRELDLSMPGPEMVMHPIVPMLDGVPISSEPRIFLQTTSDQLVHGILLRIPRVIDEIYIPRGTITEFTAFLSVIWDLCMLLYIDPKYKDLDLTRAITSGNVESVLTLGNSLQKVPQIPKADTQTFAVPITRARRKYVTAATHSDSFGKERWRHGIVDFTGTIYPGGIKSLPEEKRFTICFPGIGKEAVPSELVTASGSGLDPDISLEAALIQVKRIAAARHLPEANVQALVQSSIEKPLAGLFGTAKVNVLKLNIALDELK